MPTSIEADKGELFRLLKTHAFSRGRFILSSGKESSFYLDARLVTLSAPGAYLCARIMLDMVKGRRPDAIGGPTLGADPMVGAIASLSFQEGPPLNTFIIRKSPKAHGKQQQVEGPLLKEGSSVVIIDDVATTGKAFVESVEVLQKLNVRIQKAICVIDRCEGAREALDRFHVPLQSIFTISQFLE
ncbi:MAG: orotate phosphoribosyltransferase [Candidatus Omnitrophica bacterium]|nr:orotate phosphoribosyltransferase [Candidatus Omnitrophota bacterium]MDE2214786.1 orotate phosphoribosyltransferase [Candidatus Omnitrophota bacterium]MDE2231431.1 orotate phosphoribosyltransferase [Candidatus Omnitrophota bacterium]